MEFEQQGNLGKVDLLQRHLMLKQNRGEDGSLLLSKEEVKEIDEQLSKFSYVLSNLNLYRNALENDQYRALINVVDELEPYYRNYQPNK